ncbi:hypothetical protein HMPREF9371_1484 [Neisseria shayeganii 871]|uniref:Uncharacterized protein n=1 Tax=Neisseria shayeganii 871 TaxID=1032488 RepID=G4CIP5_9NEIS|nr:hypothetical protein HMPREF9371_1484 [Neisseria shayeganii 871]
MTNRRNGNFEPVLTIRKQFMGANCFEIRQARLPIISKKGYVQ